MTRGIAHLLLYLTLVRRLEELRECSGRFFDFGEFSADLCTVIGRSGRENGVFLPRSVE